MGKNDLESVKVEGLVIYDQDLELIFFFFFSLLRGVENYALTNLHLAIIFVRVRLVLLALCGE